ncbi:MAG: penicillin-binding transpeptidase domain-containing protein [Verrucomicrobiota bacterium]
MIVFDQLKREDPQLRLVTGVVLAGILVLLAGLWWVQIVSSRDYQANLETQSFRTVRIPAMRGKILDRHGSILAENRPVYNVSLYLEDLRTEVQQAYAEARPRKIVTNSVVFWKRWLGASNVQTQAVRLTRDQISALTWQARERVARRRVDQVSRQLQQPRTFNATEFRRHYEKSLALPFPIAKDLDDAEVARFAEQSANLQGVDLEVQSLRFYPNATAAAHLLGHLRKDESSMEGEEAFFDYRLPDYRGVIGIEGGYDSQLHGRAGQKSVLVNNLGFRQSENIESPMEPGSNVVLTIDVAIQQAAEAALLLPGRETRGAAVVMDVNSGDVLALASAPAFDPNVFIPKLSAEDNARLTDPHLRPQINRATQMQYQAGSTFKTIVALAALEKGLNPEEIYRVNPNPANPAKGIIYVGKQPFGDTAVPGDYNLRRALVRSSNAYFIEHGLRRGVLERVAELGDRLHLGEKIGLRLAQEAAGHFPTVEKVRKWTAGNSANICIGQGEMDVTPLQLAVMTSALANGGEVLYPRLVDRIASQDAGADDSPTIFPKHQVRDTLGVNPKYMRILHDDMLAETEDAVEGTGRPARVPGLKICGKTGTAERKENGQTRNTTWFISFAPYEKPKYAVVVAVEDGASGGGTCAPIAKKIYEAILESERVNALRAGPLARNN